MPGAKFTGRISMRNVERLLGLSICCGVLTACGQFSGSDSDAADDQVQLSGLTPPTAIDNLIQSRMVNRDVLFAEVTLRYEDTEEQIIASRQGTSDAWPVEFRLPGGRDFSLEVIWYDTADGERLNLVSFNRNFDAVFDSGQINFNFSDYDFDGYDFDDDDITNLAEREAGTSPIVANVGCPIVPQAQTNVNNEPSLNYENQVRFTDNFDLGLPSYSINTQRLGSANDGLVLEGVGAARLTVTGAAGETEWSRVGIVPTLGNDPDSILVRMQVLPDSTEVDSSDDSTDSRFTIDGVFFGSVEAGGVNDPQADERTGDINLRISAKNYQEGGGSEFRYCAQVRNADGSRSSFVDFAEDGDSDGCVSRVPSLPSELEPGREYLLGIGIDRQAQTIFFQIDGERVEVPSTLPMFRARSPYLEAQVSAFGEGIRSSVSVSEVSINGVVDNQLLDLDPLIAGRYRNINRHLGDPIRNVSGENARLRLEGTSADQNAVRTDLFIEGDTDYVAGDLMLSSETQVLSSDGFASVRITGSQYNDLANGGVNGNEEGNNWASLGIGVDGNGELIASACLIRSQTANFETTCSVTETPDAFCPRFSLPVQYDTEYRASITLDRENRRLVYQLNDEQIVHEITTNMFLPAMGRKAANTRIDSEGRVLGFVDNLSTIPPE